MSLSVGRAMVTDAAKQLHRAWAKTRETWDDETARRFEEELLEPLSPKIRSAVDAIERLSTAANKAERECR